MLVRGYRKGADRLVTRIAPGVVSLVAELRAHERQAAEELASGRTHHEERRVIDARRRRLHVASPQPPAGHGETAQVLPANAAAAGGRPRLDGSGSGSRPAEQVAAGPDRKEGTTRRNDAPAPAVFSRSTPDP
jgi:hypothetical protein